MLRFSDPSAFRMEFGRPRRYPDSFRPPPPGLGNGGRRHDGKRNDPKISRRCAHTLPHTHALACHHKARRYRAANAGSLCQPALPSGCQKPRRRHSPSTVHYLTCLRRNQSTAAVTLVENPSVVPIADEKLPDCHSEVLARRSIPHRRWRRDSRTDRAVSSRNEVGGDAKFGEQSATERSGAMRSNAPAAPAPSGSSAGSSSRPPSRESRSSPPSSSAWHAPGTGAACRC